MQWVMHALHTAREDWYARKQNGFLPYAPFLSHSHLCFHVKTVSGYLFVIALRTLLINHFFWWTVMEMMGKIIAWPVALNGSSNGFFLGECTHCTSFSTPTLKLPNSHGFKWTNWTSRQNLMQHMRTRLVQSKHKFFIQILSSEKANRNCFYSFQFSPQFSQIHCLFLAARRSNSLISLDQSRSDQFWSISNLSHRPLSHFQIILSHPDCRQTRCLKTWQ